MPRKVVKPHEIEIKKLPGRDRAVMISKETVGALEMTMGLFWIKPGEFIKPCHAHPNEEEAMYILDGAGKAWIDGELVDFEAGDSIFFPKGSKHMIKNSGKRDLKGVFVFAPSSDPSRYEYYPEIDFP